MTPGKAHDPPKASPYSKDPDKAQKFEVERNFKLSVDVTHKMFYDPPEPPGEQKIPKNYKSKKVSNF